MSARLREILGLTDPPRSTVAPCCGAPVGGCDCEVVEHGYHDETHPDCRLCARRPDYWRRYRR